MAEARPPLSDGRLTVQGAAMTRVIHGWGPAATLALCLFGGAAQAQTLERSYYVLDVLDDLRQEIAWRQRDAPSGEGRKAYFVEMNYLAPGGVRDMPVAMANGTDDTLTVVGYCDQDCDGLRLSVYEDGRLIDSADHHARTAVTFNRVGARAYVVRAEMTDCDATLCFFAMGAFQR